MKHCGVELPTVQRSVASTGGAHRDALTQSQTIRAVAVTVSPPSFSLPSPRRTLRALVRVWLVGLLVFGYGPALTYGWLVWLLNEAQWRWVYLMYLTEVPLIGGPCLLLLPWWWYRPIHHALIGWSHGGPRRLELCARVYERALQLPKWVAWAAFASALNGYLIGTAMVHWQANQPFIEMIPKTLPAIPLVGGMMGAFCYFGTARTLQPIVAWCSLQWPHLQPKRRLPLASKFLATTCVLSVASLCFLQPAAYTLGQLTTERHLMDRAVAQLRPVITQGPQAATLEASQVLLGQAVVGSRGYAFLVDPTGRIMTAHPRGATMLSQERFFNLARHLSWDSGAWVDRVGVHRVVAFARFAAAGWTVFSVSFPDDFALPLQQFIRWSWLVVLEGFFVLVLFGRYFTRGITAPLAELTRVTQGIAQSGDLTQRVPVTTDDELGDVARSFNHMIVQLQSSTTSMEDHARQLERTTQKLSALNQELEDLLHVASHDLRAPLINIQGFSKRLEPLMQETLRTLEELSPAGSPEQRRQLALLTERIRTHAIESLRFISQGVETMDRLLTSLLNVSRAGRVAAPLQPHDLDEILTEVLMTFGHQLAQRHIRVLRDPLPTRVPCRREELRQIFANLISNAINYMGTSPQPLIEIGGTAYPDRVECVVRDTGIGIDPRDHERIFQMFTRLQAVNVPGEGVGLAYVKKILRCRGGRIWVVSQPGHGSTFTFTLPLHGGLGSSPTMRTTGR